MRTATAALLLVLSLPVAAQDVPTGSTFSTGYATGFEAGALHSEVRFRFASSGLGLEPMLSWTKEFPYSVDYGSFCYFRGQGDPKEASCVGRAGGENAFAVGTALTYQMPEGALPLGLDGAHVGTFAQAVLPLWQNRGTRIGIEAGVDARLSERVRLGLDVQASRYSEFSDSREISVAPLLRLAVGR